jgi:hypothetical protein
MSAAKKKCQLDGCNRAASAICLCCNKNVCTRHFMEHVDVVKAQIDPLANEINTMVEKIQDLTIEQITEPSFAQLQQWKTDMYQLIDEIFLTKKKEMEDLIETNKNKFVEHKKQQLETMMKIQDDIKQLVEDGDATFEQIQLLKNQLASVETSLTNFGKYFLSVNTKVFDKGLITVSSNLNKMLPQVQRKFLPFVIFLNRKQCNFFQNRIRYLDSHFHWLDLVVCSNRTQRHRHQLQQLASLEQLQQLASSLDQLQ